MAVPTVLTDLSTTAANNSPSGSETVGSSLDDYLRGIQAVLRAGLAHKGADIPSVAGTTDLGAIVGLMHDITGTETITGFGTVSAGVWKFLQFDGALQLTYNATSMILLGSENRTTAAGDVGCYMSLGSGNWIELAFFPRTINPAKMVSTDETQTLTNKTISAASNTITNIGQTEIAASAVGQGELKTTTATGSQAVPSGDSASHTLTGGTYSWWTASSESNMTQFGNGNVAAGVIGLFNETGGSTFHVDERYVQASPPYNLGHGDIPLFVFVVFAADGSIKGINVAPDPVWAYHGPTIITPERRDKITGKSYRRYREVNGVPFVTAMKDASLLRLCLAGELQVDLVEKEITHEIKNRDMNLFPHTWVGNDLTGLSVVMLDPTSRLIDRLAILHEEAGAREVWNIVSQNHLLFENTPLDCTTPAGVIACRASLK